MAAAAGLGALPLREAIHQFMRFLVDIHAEDPGLHNALAEEIPDWELPLIQRIALTYLEAHRDEVRPENLELASRILLQAGEALVHETALRSPELLHNAEFNAEVEELFYRYLRK
ncbi:MAG: hypothetical protein O6851_07890, partial [Gemmatimonadetes bacterium]|nr:hypothetical protein [Gemmatimonadota bacterium]